MNASNATDYGEASSSPVPSQDRKPALTADTLVGLGRRLRQITVTDPEDQSVLGVVYVRPVSAGHMIEFMRHHKRDEYTAGIKLIVAAVVDEHDGPLFTEEQARAIPFRTFGVLQDAVQETLGISGAAKEEGADSNPSPAMGESGGASSIA